MEVWRGALAGTYTDISKILRLDEVVVEAMGTGSSIRCPKSRGACIFAIASGYQDADDLHRLHSDPALKLASGRLPPDTGRNVRLKNYPLWVDTVEKVDPRGFRGLNPDLFGEALSSKPLISLECCF